MLGFDAMDDCAHRNRGFGIIVGRYASRYASRYAGRIGGTRFALDGMEHQLDANVFGNCVLGGARDVGE